MGLKLKILLFMWTLVLLTGVVYTLIMVQSRRSTLIDKIDAKLMVAARAAEHALPDRYHDTLIGPESVSPQEFDRIVDSFNRLCTKLRLEYIWSVLFIDDKVVFTSATSPDKQVKNQQHAKFFDIHHDPAAFAPALDAMAPTYSSFHNEWGTGRMVLVPARDSHGRVYMMGASVHVRALAALVRKTILEGLGVGLIIASIGALISVLLANSIAAPLAQITNVAEHMAQGDLDYPVDVGGARELVTLSNSFASMRDAIRDKIVSLRNSEENLAITLNSIGDAVVAADATGRVTRMNVVAEELTGWASSEALGRPIGEIMQLVNAVSRKPVKSPVDVVLKDGRTVGLANHTILIAKDGKERQIADSGAPICDANGQIVGVVLVFRDVTQEYSLQQQLRQAQKMEAIGQLAGGVAHDFNNLLMGITGHADILRSQTPDGSEDAELLDHILHAAQRAADLTRQLLAFSRRGQFQTVEVDLHAVIADVVSLLRHSIDRRIELAQNLRASHYIVLGDPSQLESALLNLAVNARDAMPEGGQLTIGTRNVALDESFCQSVPDHVTAGAYLEIDISDTGIGMDAELQQRIFEPFFTTKQNSQGTGLGLAGVYGCVRSHHGLVRVCSKVGEGSSFKLLLPLAVAIPGTPPPVAEPPSHEAQGEGHILVVDDEEVVASFLTRSLRKRGYTVAVCHDGKEAVEYYREHMGDIGLVILDLIMPRMGGAQAFRELKKIDPDVRVLISSGFSNSSTVDSLTEQGALGFLSKPFRSAELAREVAAHMGK